MKKTFHLNSSNIFGDRLQKPKQWIIIFIFIIFGFIIWKFIFYTIKDSHAISTIFYRDDGYIELEANDLTELNNDELRKVIQITVKNEMPNDTILQLFSKCISLEDIYFSYVDIPSLTFLNSVTSNRGINLYFVNTNIDFYGFKSNNILSINIASSKIENFKQIENISSLKKIGLSESDGYEQINYSKLSKLTNIALTTYIEDFDLFTMSIPNITSLSLAGSNIQNKDTIYLERLTNLKELNLNQTYLTDIDFVKKLSQLEYFELPWAVVDLSPIYNLKNLNTLYWDAYTELYVTQDIVNYLDKNNVTHYDYNSDIRDKINSIFSKLNLTKETDKKVALEKIVSYIVENTIDVDMDFSNSNIKGTPSNLDLLIYHNKGVCYHHSIAVYTLAKALGIDDIYGVTGPLMRYTDPITGEESDSLYSLFAHAWNIMNDRGIWYGIDAAQMNDGSGVVLNFDYNFWKNPLKDDEYDINYSYENYLDFNYYFAKRHLETDGILKQTATYQFKDISGLDIKNHVIYNYDTTDLNASKLCDRVLDNYSCQYQDVDLDGRISSGDIIKILKNDIIVDLFTLSTESYVEPVKTYIGKLTLEYVNYPNINIEEAEISTLYFNEDSPLKINIKGENYDSSSKHNASLTIISTETEEEIYSNNFTITGAEINNGKSITINSGILKPKEKENSSFGGMIQYIISINIDEIERSLGINYIIENDKNINYEGFYDGQEHTIKIDENLLSCNIKYSINNTDYELNELPKFKNPGKYIVNYIVNCGGNNITKSGTVKIYGIEELDSSITLKDNVLIVNDNSFEKLKNGILTYSTSTVYSHYNINNELITSDSLKTGDIIKIVLNNTKTFEYHISVLGDTNGDGKIDYLDYVNVYNHIKKVKHPEFDKELLSNEYLLAADMSGDDKINYLDYVKIYIKIKELKRGDR